VRIRTTITYEYDVDPVYGGYGADPTPTSMAQIDIEAGSIERLIAENYHISAVEVFPGYHDTGSGCTNCGCRNAMVECENRCVPCYTKAHSTDTLQA